MIKLIARFDKTKKKKKLMLKSFPPNEIFLQCVLAANSILIAHKVTGIVVGLTESFYTSEKLLIHWPTFLNYPRTFALIVENAGKYLQS